jgi:hypothetical protein
MNIYTVLDTDTDIQDVDPDINPDTGDVDADVDTSPNIDKDTGTLMFIPVCVYIHTSTFL